MQIIEIHNEYLVWDFVRYCMWARARSFSSSALSLLLAPVAQPAVTSALALQHF